MPLTRTLTIGMHGEDVARLQKALRALNLRVEDREGIFGDSTRRAVFDFQRRLQLRTTGSFNPLDLAALVTALGNDPFGGRDTNPDTPDPNDPRGPDTNPPRTERSELIVTGLILHPDGKPIREAVVAGVSKGLVAADDKDIGLARTDAEGRYTLKTAVDSGGIDLVIEVRPPRGGGRLTRSPLVIGATGNRTVDLVVNAAGAYPAQSEYDEIARRLSPLIDGVNDPAQLDTDSVAMLHAKTGISPIRISHYLKSQAFARRGAADAQIYYGLFRANLPANGPALAAIEDGVLARAIRTASEAGVISAKIADAGEKIDELIKSVNAAEITTILDQPDLKSGVPSFATFIGLSGLSRDGRRSFVELVQSHTGRTEDFWKKLESEPRIGPAGRKQIETTARLSVLTLGNTALIKTLSERLSDADDADPLSSLVSLSRSDWEDIVNGPGQGSLPPGFAVSGNKKPQAIYARMMARMIEDAYPTQTFAARLHERDFDGADVVSRFLRNNPGFDLSSKSVRSFAAEQDLELDAKTRGALEGVQRIFALAPRFERAEVMRPILARGLTSAYQIRAMGETQFMRSFSEPLGQTTARMVFEGAQSKTALATTLFGRYGAGFNSVAMNVLPAWNIPAILGELAAAFPTVDEATWEGLFGNIDFCACEHCNSVYSPAAYMVALLKFLRDRGLLGALDSRRAEIGALHLTCDNTNVTLPYVDLVIEILEGFLTDTAAEHNTTGDVRDLRVYPEHINADAYSLLEGEVYPWTLPFSLWTEEARSYLGPLDTTRTELLDVFNPVPRPDRSPADRLAVAIEHLGLTETERDLVLNGAFNASHWGGVALGNLRTVQTLIDVARIGFQELRQLLDSRFVNAAGTLQIQYAVGEGVDARISCDLSVARIENLQTGDLNRIERFTRLRLKLGWSVHDLDVALAAAGGSLDAGALVTLSDLKWLHETYGTSLPVLSSWIADLDTRDWLDEGDKTRVSTYAGLFLNRTIGSAEDLAPFEPGALGAGDMGDHEAAILAALRIITAEELSQIRDRRLADPTLSLANLSELHRIATMKRAMGISVRDLLDLLELSALDPFGPGRLDQARRLKELLDLADETGFDIAELTYLFRDIHEPPAAFVPTDSQITVFLQSLRAGLGQLHETYRIQPDPTGDITGQMLASVVDAADLPTVLAVIDLTADPADLPADLTASLDQAFTPFIADAPTRAAIVARLVDDTDPGFLFPETQRAERFGLVLGAMAPFLERIASVALVKTSFAGFLGVSDAASDRLLRLMHSTLNAGDPASAAFLAPAFAAADTEIDAGTYPDQFMMVRRLLKAGLIVQKLGIPTEDLEELFASAATFGWIDFNNLPLSEASGASGFAAWANTASLYAMTDRAPAAETSLLPLVLQADTAGGGGSLGAFIDTLHTRLGWPRPEIEAFVDGTHFDMDDFDADWQGVNALHNLLRLEDAFAMLGKLGVAPAMAWTWTDTTVTRQIAISIKQAARAKYQPDQWYDIAEPVRDRLRDRQRAALVEAAIRRLNSPRIRDSEDLYNHFLMDVEMKPCFHTSRIVFATGAIQTFVQRVLMNLEDAASLSNADAEQWKWMKNYRVWEANVKVFISPENWIEPELRLDKSPFFQALEDTLLQGDVTLETAELAYQEYLEKLDEVAKLQVVGVWRENDTKTLHVIGRTASKPNKYFYRRWEESRRWTPWEEIPVEIEAEVVQPVIYNRRLYIFWFVTLVKADEEVPAPDTGQKPNRYMEIKLAWSQFRQRKWSGKRLTDIFVKTTRSRSDTVVTLKQEYWRPTPVIRPNGDLLIAVQATFSGLAAWLDSNYLDGPTAFRFVHDGDISLDRYGDADTHQLPFVAKDEVFPIGFAERADGGSALRLRGYNGTYQNVLDDAPHDFRLTTPLQYTHWTSAAPLFFEDKYRSYVIVPRHVFGHTPGFVGDLTMDVRPEIFMELDDLVRVNDLINGGVIGPLPDPDPVFGPDIHIRGARNPARDRLPGIGGANPGPDQMTAGVRAMRQVIGTAQPLLVHDMATPVFGGDVDVDLMTVRPDFQGGSNPLFALMSDDGTARVSPVARLLRGDSGSENFTIAAGEMAIAAGVMNMASSSGIWTFLPQKYQYTRYRFINFHHPYVPMLVRQLNRYGVEGVLNPREGGPADSLRRQQTREASNREFDDIYEPGQRLDTSNLPVEEFDFEYGSPMSVYNWELFFHIPFMIANHLSQNQRFEDAQAWYHFIFDPTDNSEVPLAMNPYRFWKVKPFYENTDIRTVEDMLRLLSSSDPGELTARRDLEAQIKDWRKNPFQPNRIAEQRPVAYQKAIVMKYLDNLIDWADQLFRQDTRQSVREATQIYVLASGMLGKAPNRIPTPAGTKTIGGNTVHSFNDLAPHLNDLDNALIMLETVLPPAELPGSDPAGGLGVATEFAAPGIDDGGSGPGFGGPDGLAVGEVPEDPPAPEIVGSTLFFCVPPNPKLLGYWDTVADRLFKIRHCLNIEGVERQLALFAPPIDPALLVRATAAGLDLGSVLSDLGAPRPHYRFQPMLRTALDLTADVKALGQALLTALEKRDGEDLALLRQRHEEVVLKSVRAVRRLRIDEAKEALSGLRNNLEGIEFRKNFHETRNPRIPNETLHMSKLELADTFDEVSRATSLVASALAAIPEFDVGAEGGFSSPTVKVQFGGANLSKAASLASQILGAVASSTRNNAQRASIRATYDRRQEEWDFSAAQAGFDAQNMEIQIAGAEVRLAVAERELENQEQQIEQSQEIHRFMRDKFTNRDLYSWMVKQVSGLYFQTYQLAYDLAKRAERAFQHELADSDASFVGFGHWTGLRKGLVAGEKLQLDLRRMETAYREQNRREFELTRHCSLAQIDPAALIQLRQTGRCEFEVPEAFFNLDHPSHYLRRLKSVGVTVPCVTGPYSGVNATLTLLQNRIRRNSVNADQPYAGPNDANFIVNTGGIQSVAISSGRDDAGLFQLSYQDERYLPFEGAGAVSRWRIELADPFRGFDYDSISDVVLKIAYTAREGGQAVAAPVIAALDTRLGEIVNATAATGLYRLFQLRRDFGTVLHHFLHPAGANDHAAEFELSVDHLPYVFRGRTIDIDNVTMVLELTDPMLHENGAPFALTLQRAGGATQAQDLLAAGGAFGGLPHAEFTNKLGTLSTAETWSLSTPSAAVSALPAGLRTTVDVGGTDVPRIRADLVRDIAILMHYTVS
ncbi:Tc toxin subunit A-related protein [Sedimentitalea todarodis]|uniref:Neuraminidase-like domain-containing protein n=1 Tax=Sedimentitalea todarodis TaxID=1631240 RepID=A0ABU3VIY0_9RHOB|nr:neuraminidase-like domain-containing protein [Sedimentitalea todarodis]MDU9005965.1 neuraminidase-like domain-containing protein [Sedimentitalea todarodis]